MIRIRILVAFVLSTSCAAIGGAQQGVPSSPSERHRLDLDGDGVPDQVILWRAASPDGSGTHDRLEVRLSRFGVHSVTGRWDALRPGDGSIVGNLIASRAIFVAKLPEAGTVMFLFGEDLGCCLQGLDIFRITPTGLQSYLHRDQFAIMRPLNLRSTSVVQLVGKENFSETAGTSAPDAEVAGSYDPVLVYQLGAIARLDSTASVRATRAALGGFAGLSSRVDVMSVVRRDKSRYLWDEVHKRRLP